VEREGKERETYGDVFFDLDSTHCSGFTVDGFTMCVGGWRSKILSRREVGRRIRGGGEA